MTLEYLTNKNKFLEVVIFEFTVVLIVIQYHTFMPYLMARVFEWIFKKKREREWEKKVYKKVFVCVPLYLEKWDKEETNETCRKSRKQWFT